MDVFVDQIIFEPDPSKPKAILPEGIPEGHVDVMKEFLESIYVKGTTLCMDRFLDEDRTIDLEKLELAIQLLIEYLEFLNKSKKPIYVFLGGMQEYFELRNVDLEDMDRIIEESSFLLGYCNAAAQEFATKKIIVQYWRQNV